MLQQVDNKTTKHAITCQQQNMTQYIDDKTCHKEEER